MNNLLFLDNNKIILFSKQLQIFNWKPFRGQNPFFINLVKIVAGMTSLMSSPFSAMSPFCAAQSYAPLTAK